jgi:hypothetical protein
VGVLGATVRKALLRTVQTPPDSTKTMLFQIAGFHGKQLVPASNILGADRYAGRTDFFSRNPGIGAGRGKEMEVPPKSKLDGHRESWPPSLFLRGSGQERNGKNPPMSGFCASLSRLRSLGGQLFYLAT